MAEVNRKSKSAIKFNSGNNIYVKYGATDWENLGNLEAGKLVTDTTEVDAPFADGTVMTRGGLIKKKLTLILSQSNKAVLDRILALNKCVVKCYYYNGSDGGVHDEFFFPECVLIDKGTIDMAGNKQQNYEILLTIVPQDALATCTPSTDLPTVKKSVVATAVPGLDNFYVRVETALP